MNRYFQARSIELVTDGNEKVLHSPQNPETGHSLPYVAYLHKMLLFFFGGVLEVYWGYSQHILSPTDNTGK